VNSMQFVLLLGSERNSNIRIQWYQFFFVGYYCVLKCGSPDGFFTVIGYCRNLYLVNRNM